MAEGIDFTAKYGDFPARGRHVFLGQLSLSLLSFQPFNAENFSLCLLFEFKLILFSSIMRPFPAV